MNNLLNSIKTRFFNAGFTADSCELKNIKSENAAARVLTPGMPRAQYSDSRKPPVRSLFSKACQSVNALVISAKASALGQAMVRGFAALESTLSPVHADKIHSVSVKRSSALRASPPSPESAALAKVSDAIGRKEPNETIKALREMHALVGSDEEKLDQLVMIRFKTVGKTQINAFHMLDQFLSNDPWKGEQQRHDDADRQVRELYGNLCRSFEASWTAMPR
ncbi:hypothetical protein ABC383_15490 [Noviherbaspirillum sp. 1P10PC]|uniref:hypothetical protein n=1 Tax=Noviherbaspirillum sp. 1P10PC TaxID=3132292 RepID=UPI00399FA87E